MFKFFSSPPPKADKVEYEYKIHGTSIKDEYAWLRDKNWPNSNLNNPKITEYLNQENQYFDNYFAKHKNSKDAIFEELKSRIQLDDSSVPIKKDNYFYYSRTISTGDYKIYCRKKGSLDANEEILLDVNKLAEGKNFTNLRSFAISPDHKKILYSIDHKGDEKYDIKILNIADQKYLDIKIENVSGSALWHEDGKSILYTRLNENSRIDRVYALDTAKAGASEQLLYKEDNNLYQVHIAKSSSKEFILINSSGHEDNEVHAIAMKDAALKVFCLRRRAPKIFYHIDHGGKNFFIHSNFGEDGGLKDNFQIFTISSEQDTSKIEKSAMDNFISEEKHKYLTDFDITKKYLILNYLDQKEFTPEVKILKFSGGDSRAVTFPDKAFSAGAYSTNYEEDDIRIDYTSQIRPHTIYQFDFTKDSPLSVLKVQNIPSGFDTKQYHTDRIFAPSTSSPGVMIPITLVYKKDLFKADGSNPLYLYGYGSYGYGITPGFSSKAISLVNRGFVFAIAHIRGGDELGKAWHDQAKFLNKKRTFDDFIDCADHLIAQKYTKQGRITASGGSAGGLLVGAVLNMRPDLFQSAIAHVPFVDVVNTMLDETLPLTPGEFKEWGNPKEKKYFEYMLSYSPYDNVSVQNYPNIMVTTALSDIRVGYWEAAKWVARLRSRKTDNNLIILKTNMSQGHGGASGRFDYLKEVAEEIVFAVEQEK